MKADHKERLFYIDLLKVIALIIMPFVHINSVFFEQAQIGHMEYAVNIALVDRICEIMYLFGPGVFMICMGCSMVMSSNSTPAQQIKRGLHLLLVGLILNFIRGTLVYSLGGFLYGDKSMFFEGICWLFGSDILYFAGLFFILFGWLRKMQLSDRTILVIAVLMQIAGSILPAIDTGSVLLNAVIGNIIYINEYSFFPLVLWTIYPVIGYMYQKGYDASSDKTKYVIEAIIKGAAVLIVFCAGMLLTNNSIKEHLLWGRHALTMRVPEAVITISIEFIYMGLLYFAVDLIHSLKVRDLISRIARKVNTIYCIHWVIEMNVISIIFILFDIRIHSIFWVFAGGAAIFILSTVLAFLWDRIRAKHAETAKQ